MVQVAGDTAGKMKPSEIVFCLVVVVATIGLLLLPSTKYYDRPESEREARGKVLEVEDQVFQRGIFKQGEQRVEVKLLDGPDKGKVFEASNLLQGNLEMEWYYNKGDVGIVGYSISDGEIAGARMLEPLRQSVSIAMFATFFIILLLFAGWTGAKAILSFVFTIVAIWKLLLPQYLGARVDPVLLSILVISILTAVIIFLVAGISKKGLAAYLGSISGCLISWLALIIFGGPMRLNGTTEGYATMLHFSGFVDLDLLRLFYAGAILSASGAIMDIAMDIAAAMDEIRIKKPTIGRWELIRSGNNIGRAVIGTMSTTLLLAYSGSALTMLMLMMTKGISLWRIANMNLIGAEVVKVLSGTLGLALVAPLTALIGGIILVPLKREDTHAPLRADA